MSGKIIQQKLCEGENCTENKFLKNIFGKRSAQKEAYLFGLTKL